MDMPSRAHGFTAELRRVRRHGGADIRSSDKLHGELMAGRSPRAARYKPVIAPSWNERAA